MGNFSAFLISFCTSVILLGFLYMLCPSGNISKTVKYVFCLCFVCCILSSIAFIPKGFSIEFETHENTAQAYNGEYAVEAVFREALKSNDINFKKIEIDVNKSESDGITINKVIVYTTETKEKIEQIIGSDSYAVEVINE